MEDLEFMNKMWDKGLLERLHFVLEHDFKRLDYTEGIEILKASGRKFEFPCDWGCDLQSEHERYLVEEHFKRPVILIPPLGFGAALGLRPGLRPPAAFRDGHDQHP